MYVRGFFSGLGAEGRLKSHIADNQVITLHTLLFLQIFNKYFTFLTRRISREDRKGR